jgi:anaerobic selenocysteine-containing dehydrogenase
MSDKGPYKAYSGCALCYHSCGVEVTIEDGKAIKVEGQKGHPLNDGKLCPKGQAMIEHLYHPDRLKYPLKKVNGEFVRVSWDQALSEIAETLDKLRREHGPAALAFFCGSIGVENLEMISLTHRFKAAFGSPNFFSVESICYRMRIRARQITFGKYPVEEMDSKLYLLWGHNPAASDFPSPCHRGEPEEGLQGHRHRPEEDPHRRQGGDLHPHQAGTDGRLRWP